MEDDFLSRIRARDAAVREGAGRNGTPASRGRGGWFFGASLTVLLLGAVGVGYYAWQNNPSFNLGSAGLTGADGGARAGLAGSPRGGAEGSYATDPLVIASQEGGVEARVAAMEQRLARLDLQAQAAAGNAARAEGLLIAFATRRAIERGAPLGYLATQLNLRFGDARPNSVRTVIDAAENPVTLDQLMARLEGLAPRLANQANAEVSWSWFQRELGEMFIVRRETSPSPQPARRLDRARQFLESGRIDAAVAEVRNLPGASGGEAQRWIADAERYANVQRALELIETTAILEPRELRDSAGNRVEQPSPVSGQL